MDCRTTSKSKLPALVLTDKEKQHFERLRTSRTAAVREVQRAQILWHYHEGMNPTRLSQAPQAGSVAKFWSGSGKVAG